MRYATVAALILSILAAAMSPVAYAQMPVRTWVSGAGNDANDCSRTLPCETFGGALGKTAAGGEIDVLDPGSFGPVLITKSVTIDAKGVAGISTVAVGGYGIAVSAGNDDVVILRGLDIKGVSDASHGIFFANGKKLIIEDTRISGFSGNGVWVPVMASAAGNVVIRNSTIAQNTVALGGSQGNANGILVDWGITEVSHSLITGMQGIGLIVRGIGVIDADSNVLTDNGIAVQSGDGGPGQGAATVRLSNNDVYGNRTGFGCGGGVLASNGTNRKGSNTGGSVAACAPNATITQQ